MCIVQCAMYRCSGLGAPVAVWRGADSVCRPTSPVRPTDRTVSGQSRCQADRTPLAAMDGVNPTPSVPLSIRLTVRRKKHTAPCPPPRRFSLARHDDISAVDAACAVDCTPPPLQDETGSLQGAYLHCRLPLRDVSAMRCFRVLGTWPMSEEHCCSDARSGGSDRAPSVPLGSHT